LDHVLSKRRASVALPPRRQDRCEVVCVRSTKLTRRRHIAYPAPWTTAPSWP